MPADPNIFLSPITGKMVHLPQAVSAPPANRDKEKSTSTSRLHEQYSPMWPPPPLYYPFVQPPTTFSPVTHICNHHTYNINNHYTYNINQYHSPKVSCSHHSPPSHSSHHHPSHTQPSKSPTSTHNSRHSPPSHANRAIEPSTHSIHRHFHSTKAKCVHFTESVSIREKERKKCDHCHHTSHASKSGKKPETMRIERLCCDTCSVGSQRWHESGSGRGVKLCEECYWARERKRQGKR